MNSNLIHRDTPDYWKTVTNTPEPAHPTPMESVYKTYLDRLDIQPGHHVLDIGIGFGRFVPYYQQRGAKITGIDIDPNMARETNKLFGDCVNVVICDSTNVPFDDGSFDHIICWAVFDELDQAATLLEANRVLKPGGRFIVTGKNESYEPDDADAVAAEIGARGKFHPNFFTKVAGIDWDRYGFRPVFSRYFRRRGDFAQDSGQDDRPERFYEYLLILERTGPLADDLERAAPISAPVSRTLLETRGEAIAELGCRPGKKPIFISGVYRSGTTIAAQIVGAHRDIALTFDSVKFTRFCLNRYSPIDDPANRERLVRDTHARLSLRWHMTFDVDAMVEAVRAAPQGYAGVYDTFMRHLLSDGTDAKRWGEKTAVMWSTIPAFLTMFPDGKVIHVMRDPRDATASYKKLTYEPGYTYLDCALNCLAAMHDVPAFRQRFGADQVMVVRFEDLVRFPEDSARRICDFLDLPYDPAMIDPTRFRNKEGGQWENNSIFRPDMKGISADFERWREGLTRAEVIFIELVAAREMEQLGYQPSGFFPTADEWQEIHGFFQDPFLSKRVEHWLRTGTGQEGYRSDPIEQELKAVAEALANQP